MDWQLAEVREVIYETPRVRSLLLQVKDWRGHRPGQRVDIRLTAEGGYQAERSYSIASPPEEPLLALTVERVPGGEVSSYLVDEVRAGDTFELRGPIGGHFVWTAGMGGPLNLIGGGSGVVPLVAMLRHRSRTRHEPASLLYSSRTVEDIIFHRELEAMGGSDPTLHVVHALTRQWPDCWIGHRGRIEKSLLARECFPPASMPRTYICGPTSFVEDVSAHLVALGYHPHSIRTERFGPTGSQS
jgi:ferredoxin-NADP reductase